MTDEEARAAAYRASALRRRAAERTRERLLAGNPTAARAVREDWQAIRDYTRDREGDHRGEPDPSS